MIYLFCRSIVLLTHYSFAPEDSSLIARYAVNKLSTGLAYCAIDIVNTILYDNSMKENKLKMIELKAKGLSYQSIGLLYGVSRQRVHAIINNYKPISHQTLDIKEIFNKVKERDKMTCQWGVKCSKANNKLVIHHIDFNDENNKLENLLTLCNKCHLYFHRLHETDYGKTSPIDNQYITIQEEIKKRA